MAAQQRLRLPIPASRTISVLAVIATRGDFDAYPGFDHARDRNDSGCRPRTGADLRSELPGLHEGIHRSKRRRRRVERLHVYIAGAVRGYRVRPPGNMHGKSVLRVRRHEASSPESAAGLLSTTARYAWIGCDGREARLKRFQAKACPR